jgi:hypothetical protein
MGPRSLYFVQKMFIFIPNYCQHPMFIYIIYICMGNSIKCGEFGMSYKLIFLDCQFSIIAMRFSFTSGTIKSLGPPFLVAHGNIGKFEAMTKWEYTNVGLEFVNNL